jgi:hypothetical protein
MTTGQCNTNLEANVKTEVCRRTNRTILLRKRMRVKKGEKMIPGAGGWGQTREVEAIDYLLYCKAKDVIKGGDDEGEIVCVQLKVQTGTCNH